MMRIRPFASHGSIVLPGSKPLALLFHAAYALCLAAPAAAQQVEAAPRADAGAAGQPTVLLALDLAGRSIDVDGRIEEEAWLEASPISDFTQQEPREGSAPTERTEIRAAFDQDNLYLAAILFDEPSGIVATQRQRDGSLFNDDRLAFILDTFLDGRTGYRFEVNPAGAMVDGLVSGGGGGGGGGRGGPGGFGGAGNAWDGIWEARTQRRPDGWSAEIRIPFRTLNFNPALTEWGINFERTIRRKNEDILWRGWRRTEGLGNPVFAGRMRGLSGMSQGIGLEAVPSAIASWRHTPCTDPTGCGAAYDDHTFPYDVSLDVNYSVTSSLRASASVNTDFAEVEADRRQVNLTRFPLRFPELRDFFLEGSGVFDFVPRQGAQPFYSRNIGLDPRSGQPLPILYGTRLTGQAGPYELGFYQIGTRDHTYLDAAAAQELTIQREDFTVARVKRRFWEQSSLGFIYTLRSNATDATGLGSMAAHTAGVDAELATRSFLGDKNLSLNAFVAWNSDLDPQSTASFPRSFGRLSARGARLVYPNDIWYAHISYREFGDDYDPALGFVVRNNFRRVEPNISWSPRPDVSWIRNLSFGAQYREQRTMSGPRGGNLEEQELRLDAFGITFQSGARVSVQATRSHEFLERNFPISSNVSLTPGDYRWWEYQVSGNTPPGGRAGGFASFSRGGFWDGDRTRINGVLNLRPSALVNLSINFEHNDVTHPQGDFQANVYSLTSQWTPNPWVGLTNQLQYDDVSEVVGLFLRLRWIVQPGNDVYLVYTHNWRNFGGGILDDPELRTLSNGGSIKLNYTHRF